MSKRQSQDVDFTDISASAGRLLLEEYTKLSSKIKETMIWFSVWKESIISNQECISMDSGNQTLNGNNNHTKNIPHDEIIIDHDDGRPIFVYSHVYTDMAYINPFPNILRDKICDLGNAIYSLKKKQLETKQESIATVLELFNHKKIMQHTLGMLQSLIYELRDDEMQNTIDKMNLFISETLLTYYAKYPDDSVNHGTKNKIAKRKLLDTYINDILCKIDSTLKRLFVICENDKSNTEIGLAVISSSLSEMLYSGHHSTHM